MTRLLLALAVAAALGGCKGDPSSPDYWDKQVKRARRTADKARVFDDLRASGKVNASFLPFLLEHLKDEKKAETRAAVARAIGTLKDPATVQPLSDAVDLAATDTDTSALNKAIAQSLAQIGGAAGVPVLLRMLKAKDPIVQVEAITALGQLRAKEAVDPLVQKAQDNSIEPFIIKKALTALGDIGDPRAVPVLIKRMYWQHPRGQVFYGESSFALFQIGQPAADAVLPVLRGQDAALMAWAKQNDISEAALYSKSAQVMGDLHDKRAEADLLKRLSEKGDPSQQVYVRLTASDALGKLRSKDAVKPLSGFLPSEEPVERDKYCWALARIGGRDALPALAKAATVGLWPARQPVIIAIGLLGDERDKATLDKLKAEEPARTAKECGEEPGLPGCGNAKSAGDKHASEIAQWGQALDAARECASDAACWTKKLEDKTPQVRERAALELGRAGNPASTAALLKHLSDDSLDVRQAAIQGVDWLLDGSKDAERQALADLDKIDQQLETEHGKTELVKANEDLRRLAARLHRQKGA
ncbi:MAG TPA: HEAT repeat domain-containing protein [Myxococcales bacterium]|nr:HEAT repeat domain-containing protein [Myxococcales bacterium]